MDTNKSAETGEGNAPRTITKYFAAMKKAEQYRSRLYAKYDRVELVGFPRFSEAGTYTWKVA